MRWRAGLGRRTGYPVFLDRFAKTAAYLAGIALLLAAIAEITIGSAAVIAPKALQFATAPHVASDARQTSATLEVTQAVLADDWFRSWGYPRRSSAGTAANQIDKSQRSNLMRPPEPPSFSAFGGERRRERSKSWWDWDDDDRDEPPPPVGGYRTLCVRTCDGFYFPISFTATPDRFARDEATCQSSCGSEARLFVYRNPGQDPDQMVDLRGQPYVKLKTAFLYRTSYNESCKCRPQPWEQASLDRHKMYALEARASKGDRVARQAIEDIRAKNRQAAIDKRNERRAAASKRRQGQAVAAAPVAPVAPSASSTDTPGATTNRVMPRPAAAPAAAPEPRAAELRPDAASGGSDVTASGDASPAPKARSNRKPQGRQDARSASRDAPSSDHWSRRFLER